MRYRLAVERKGSLQPYLRGALAIATAIVPNCPLARPPLKGKPARRDIALHFEATPSRVCRSGGMTTEHSSCAPGRNNPARYPKIYKPASTNIVAKAWRRRFTGRSMVRVRAHLSASGGVHGCITQTIAVANPCCNFSRHRPSHGPPPLPAIRPVQKRADSPTWPHMLINIPQPYI